MDESLYKTVYYPVFLILVKRPPLSIPPPDRNAKFWIDFMKHTTLMCCSIGILSRALFS